MPPLLTARYSPAATVYKELPVSLISSPAGEMILDTGQNIAGIFRFRVCLPAGQELHLQFGEELQDGNFYRDNLRTAKAEYVYMGSWVDYINRVDGDDCHWREVFHYGNWLALDCTDVLNQNSGATDPAFIADVYYRYSAMLVADAAGLLGYPKDQDKYSSLAERLLERIRMEFYSPNGRCCISTQTACVLTLKHGLSPERRSAAMLRKLIEDNNGRLNTGFVGTPLLCDVLSEHGTEDLAERLLLNEDYPGWLYLRAGKYQLTYQTSSPLHRINED